MFEKEIEEVKAAQVKRQIEEDIILRNVKHMDQQFTALVMEKWNKKFPNIPMRVLCCFNGGCLANSGWKPSAFVSKVAGLTLMEDGTWRRYSYTLESEEKSPLAKEVIDEFCKEIRKETDIEFDIYEHDMPTPREDDDPDD